jgi:hypothetical protein
MGVFSACPGYRVWISGQGCSCSSAHHSTHKTWLYEVKPGAVWTTISVDAISIVRALVCGVPVCTVCVGIRGLFLAIAEKEKPTRWATICRTLQGWMVNPGSQRDVI